MEIFNDFISAESAQIHVHNEIRNYIHAVMCEIAVRSEIAARKDLPVSQNRNVNQATTK
jgi:hypothetical protein